MPGKSALVFGASGVSGWAFVNEILNDYPKAGVWDKVHALTNRPLSQKDSAWPNDPRLNIVCGIDLLKGSQEELEAQIKEKVEGVGAVTHVYYLAYKANKDAQQQLADAVAMFSRSTIAMDHLSSSLEFVVLQTGSRMYGNDYLRDRPAFMVPPLKESLPRIPPPRHDLLFYHHQLDWIESYAASKSWNWCETRPDIIVGLVPNQNAYSLATVLGIYFSLYREVEGGEGVECPFPGTPDSWITKNNDSSADMIARQTIHVSLTLPASRKGEAFNVADAREPQTWSTKWPQFCAYFGLKGTGPLSSPEEAEKHEVRRYINTHLQTWQAMEEKHGLRRGIADSSLVYGGFEHWLLTRFDFDRQFDMTKMYETTGFKEERSVMDAWGSTFDRMRSAKIIP